MIIFENDVHQFSGLDWKLLMCALVKCTSRKSIDHPLFDFVHVFWDWIIRNSGRPFWCCCTRNTPNQSSRLSPAEMLYGHKIRDHLPNKFRKLRKDWRAVKRMQEMKHVCLPHENTRQERTLKPLAAGDAVSVQNQKGNKPNKWHNTGKVVEALPNRKYKIILDGSRNVTNRNRKFIRPILERCRNKPDPDKTLDQQ